MLRPVSSRSRRLMIGVVVAPLLTVAVVLGAIVSDWYVALPPGIRPTYVGRDTCARCHAEQVAAFTGSHHDRAMDLASPETVLADFDDAVLEHDGLTTRFFRRGEEFWVETEGPDGEPAEYQVRYVFGVEPLQQYIVEMNRPADLPAETISRAQVLRASWDTREKRWFHLRPPDVDERVMPGDPLHWTGSTQCWNTSCADCHSTDLKKNFDLAKLDYRTTFSEIDVSCEACHGPGSMHVDLAEGGGFFWDRRYGYGLAKFTKEEPRVEVETCARCHSRRQVLDENTFAGQRLTDGMSCGLLTDGIYHADGQILEENFEFGSFTQSRMYHQQIRCTDCHDPHTARVRYQGNALCTTCHQHPAGKYDTPAHHQHKVGSTGSQCVDCHMPESFYMQVDGRRDHSIRIPRPDLSVQLGTPNACTQCHLQDSKLPRELDRDLGRYQDWLTAAREGDTVVANELERLDQWSADAIERWYGPRERPDTFAPILARAWERDETVLRELAQMARAPVNATIVRASALAALQNFPDETGLKSSLDALGDSEPMVVATALVGVRDGIRTRVVRIDESGGFDPLAELVEPVKPLLVHPSRWVRNEAALCIAALGPARGRMLDKQERLEFDAAVLALRDSFGLLSDHASSHLGLGLLEEDLGNIDAAIAAYRDGIRVDPNAVGPRSNLANLLERRADAVAQRTGQAVAAAMQQPGGIDGSGREAIAEARRSEQQLRNEIATLRAEELPLLELDARRAPDFAPLQYRYGMLLYLNGRLDDAAEALDRARQLAPREIEYRFAVALMRKEQGRWREVLELSEELIAENPTSSEFRLLRNEARARLAIQEGDR